MGLVRFTDLEWNWDEASSMTRIREMGGVVFPVERFVKATSLPRASRPDSSSHPDDHMLAQTCIVTVEGGGEVWVKASLSEVAERIDAARSKP